MTRKIEILIPAVRVTIDVDGWAESYNVPATNAAVRDDVRAYFEGFIEAKLNELGFEQPES